MDGVLSTPKTGDAGPTAMKPAEPPDPGNGGVAASIITEIKLPELPGDVFETIVAAVVKTPDLIEPARPELNKGRGKEIRSRPADLRLRGPIHKLRQGEPTHNRTAFSKQPLDERFARVRQSSRPPKMSEPNRFGVSSWASV